MESVISAHSAVNVHQIKNLCALSFWKKTEKTIPAGVTLLQQENSKRMVGERNIVHGQRAYICANLCAKNIICASSGFRDIAFPAGVTFCKIVYL